MKNRKRNAISIFFACVVMVAMAVCGCQGQQAQQAPQKSLATLGRDSQLMVRAGTSFFVQAHGNPTTGYSWKYANATENDGVQLVRESYDQQKAPEGFVGVPGTFEFEFSAVREGRYTLNFEYRRPWEKEENPTSGKVTIVVEPQK